MQFGEIWVISLRKISNIFDFIKIKVEMNERRTVEPVNIDQKVVHKIEML
jgi:hypothetical protein